MRTPFANPERIRKAVLAKQNTFDGTLEGWWRSKYKTIPVQWGKRTKGDLIEEYYWDLVLKKDELEDIWKREGGNEIAERLTRINQLLQGAAVQSGKSGDPWFDDWDGDEPEPKPKKEPEPKPILDDDWKDVTYDAD